MLNDSVNSAKFLFRIFDLITQVFHVLRETKPRRTMILRPINISTVSLNQNGFIVISTPNHVFNLALDLEGLEFHLLVEIKVFNSLFAIKLALRSAE